MKLLFRILRRVICGYFNIKCNFQLITWRTLFANRFSAGVNFKFGRLFSLSLDLSASEVYLGDNVLFRDFCVLRSEMGGRLHIGNNNFFNNSCSITCLHSIHIGDNCQFGESVKFYDHDHMYKDGKKSINEQGYSMGKITVGNNCWLGSNVIVLKNAIIGDNVVIGAGCIIRGSIPSNTLVFHNYEQVVKSY